MLSYPEFLLALTMWREARGEGKQGMRAVGHVVRNRVFARWGNWIEVITAPKQFTSINPPRSKEGWPMDGQTAKWPEAADLGFVDAEQLAAEIYRGRDPDITEGALYYANLDNITPGGWFERNILANSERFPRSAMVGRHTFFREVKPK